MSRYFTEEPLPLTWTTDKVRFTVIPKLNKPHMVALRLEAAAGALCDGTISLEMCIGKTHALELAERLTSWANATP